MDETDNDAVNISVNEDSTGAIHEQNLIIKSVNSLSASRTCISEASVMINPMSPEISSQTLSKEPLVPNVSPDYATPTDELTSQIEGDGNVGFCVQLMYDNKDINPSPPKKAKFSNNNTIDPASVILIGDLQGFDTGRRTLNKASAKATMSNEIEIGESELCEATYTDTESSIVGLSPEECDNDNAVTIQSARIRSRNDRMKAMDENGKNEEELGCNFRNLFEQVVQGTCLKKLYQDD